jgi:hypothetical protein
MNNAPLSLPHLPAARRDGAAWLIAGAMTLMIAIGAGLRLAGTRGDLWLDEIWTLALIEPISWVGEIFWGINNDNNHFLNSIYLYAVGADAPVIVQRGLSVVLGTAAIAAAGLVAIRSSRAAALIAMALFAISYPMVHFGSEARGYAGLVLFALLALVCLLHELDRPQPANRFFLGAAIGLGLLAHLTMAATAVVLALWTFWLAWRRTGSLRAAEVETRTIFRPALVWALAIGAVMVFGMLRHGFTVGGVDPFEPARFVAGYGGLIRLLLGLPEQVPDWACLAGAALAVIAAAIVRRHDRMTSLYVGSVILLPAAMFVAHLPNLQFPRYYLFAGAMLLIFLAEWLARAWRRGGAWRAAALLAMLAFACGNAASLRSFFEGERGHYAAAVARMAEHGAFVYGSDHDFRTPLLVDFFARRQGVTAHHASLAEWCRTTPQWLLIENPTTQARADLDVTAPTCALHYRRDALFSAWGLSGWRWALYRLDTRMAD